MRNKWWTLGVVCIAIFMLLLDITVVNVALPKIQTDLNASFADLQWVVDAYALTLAALLLTSGSIADLLGRRRVFVIGIGIFSLASLLCGLATDPLFLTLSRGAQGIGGAIMFATSLSLLAQDFHGKERGTAFGIWGATTGLAVAIGPLVGGGLTDSLGWRWIFFVNVPVGVLAMAVSVLRVRDSRDPEGARIDWAGVVTFSGALFALVFALVRGNREGWSSPIIVGLLVGAAVLLAAFIFVEKRGRSPMFELGLFAKPAFTGAQIAAFAISASMFSMFLYMTLYLQNDLGLTPWQTGLRFLPVSVLAFLAAAPAGKLSAHVPPRLLLGAGLGLIGVGLILMHGLDPGSDWTALLPGFIVAGTGIGLTNPPLASTAISVVRRERSGMASGINNTMRQVGVATGIAGLGATLQERIQASFLASSSGAHVPARAVPGIVEALATGRIKAVAAGAPPQFRAVATHDAATAFLSGLNDIFLIGAVIAFAGSAAALVLVRGKDFVASGPQAAPAREGAELEPAG